MPKKDPIIVALGDCPKKWNQFLRKNYGLPDVPQSRYEVCETDVCIDQEGERDFLEDVAGRQIRLGEEPPKGLLKVWAEFSYIEHEPTEEWKRSQAFIRVFSWIFALQKKLTKQKRDELLKHVDDLKPNNRLPVFDKSLGTPEEFLQRWREYLVDVHFVRKNRGVLDIRISRYPLPPDEEEDLDEADEPPGQWKGLAWNPDPPNSEES